MRIINKMISVVVCTLLFISVSPRNIGECVPLSSNELDQIDDVKDSLIPQNEIPEAIDYSNVIQRGHCKRLYTKENGLYSFVFANNDGTNSFYLFSYPVKYYDSDGKILDKTLNIIEDRKGDSFITESSDITTVFNRSLSEGIILSFEDYELSLYPNFISNKSEDATLSSDSKKVFYDCGNNTSLEYSLTYQGFKENIILNNKQCNNQYSFTLKTNGLSLINDKDGAKVCNSSGVPVAYLGQIIAYDSSDNAFKGDIKCDTIIENEEYAINISIDRDYLEDEKTIYPVYIDPTIEVDYTHCGPYGFENEPAIVNACIFSDGTWNTNCLSWVGKYSSSSKVRTIMRFPGLIASDYFGFFYLDKNLINSATIYLRDIVAQSAPVIVNCHQYKNSWQTHNQLTWNDYADYYDSEVLSSNCISGSNGMQQTPINTYAFDITSLAKKWNQFTSSPDSWRNGVMFKASQTIEEGEPLYATFGSYSSFFYSPYLVIDYDTYYDYDYEEEANISYTYHNTVTLTSGNTYIFETGPSSTYDSYDTELYLFKKDMNADDTDTWYSDDISLNNRFSRIEATIQNSGEYILMAKCYSATSYTGSVYHGYCNIYQVNPLNNVRTTLCEDAELGGYVLSLDPDRVYSLSPPDNKYSTNYYNSFTTNRSSSTVDPMLYVISADNNTKKVIGYNDDYVSSESNHIWGKDSRVRQNYCTPKPSTIFVSSWSTTSTGSADIYAMCHGEKKANLTDTPNRKVEDSIISAPQSDAYNCISYSGGITGTWINTNTNSPGEIGDRLSPWYDTDNEVALDNYYGNNPPRYAGATTYEETNNPNDAVINVYKNGNTWTHAAVRKPGNAQIHGYAWESKMGGNYRIFHVIDGLNNDDITNPNAYGHIAKMYKISNNNLLTSYNISFQESILRGMTLETNASLTTEQKDYLYQKVKVIDLFLIEQYEQLFDEWIKRIVNDERLCDVNDFFIYANTDEYEQLVDLISLNPKLNYYAMLNYIDSPNIYNRLIILNNLVAKNEITKELADNIRIKNNNVSIASLNTEVYIAPSIKLNTMEYIGTVLNDDYAELIENRE